MFHFNYQKMEEVVKLLNETKSDVSEIKTDIALMKALQVVQIDKQNSIENKLSDVEEKLNELYERDAAKNIIIYNIKEDEENNRALFNNMQEIMKEADVKISDICISDIQRLGRKNENNTRPVVVKLIAPRWKYEFFDKEEKLKSMGLKISSDIPKEKRKLKSLLLRARYLLRQEGKTPVLKNYKLFLNERQLTEREIQKICDGKNTSSLVETAEPQSVENSEVMPVKTPDQDTNKIINYLKTIPKTANLAQNIEKKTTRSTTVRKK